MRKSSRSTKTNIPKWEPVINYFISTKKARCQCGKSNRIIKGCGGKRDAQGLYRRRYESRCCGSWSADKMIQLLYEQQSKAVVVAKAIELGLSDTLPPVHRSPSPLEAAITQSPTAPLKSTMKQLPLPTAPLESTMRQVPPPAARLESTTKQPPPAARLESTTKQPSFTPRHTTLLPMDNSQSLSTLPPPPPSSRKRSHNESPIPQAKRKTTTSSIRAALESSCEMKIVYFIFSDSLKVRKDFRRKLANDGIDLRYIQNVSMVGDKVVEVIVSEGGFDIFLQQCLDKGYQIDIELDVTQSDENEPIWLTAADTKSTQERVKEVFLARIRRELETCSRRSVQRFYKEWIRRLGWDE
jgi:hypothetical protein